MQICIMCFLFYVKIRTAVYLLCLMYSLDYHYILVSQITSSWTSCHSRTHLDVRRKYTVLYNTMVKYLDVRMQYTVCMSILYNWVVK